MIDDVYNSIEVGDTVERISGPWHGHGVGWIGVVTGLDNGHLQFEDSGSIGHSPRAHRIVKKACLIKALFDRTAKSKLI